jgi:amino acid adenylation domain-containing protein
MAIEFHPKDIEQSIPERFKTVVASAPEAVAVRTRTVELTFAHLDCWSDAIAADLLDRLGLSSEPVPFLLPQGPLALAATLGILKAGKFYVPIDPSWGPQRTMELVGELNVRIVLTDAEFGPSLYSNGATVMELSPDLREGSRAIDVRIGADEPAYVYFTSGSTGRSKGVIDCHRNVLHNVMRYTHSLRIESADRLSLVQSCGFSGAVSSMFAALLNGATSCPVDRRVETPARLARWLDDLEVTIYHSVPSLFRSIVSAGEVFQHVRVVRLEGDRSDLLDLELFRRHFAASAILVVGLGTTETGLVCQYFFGSNSEMPAGVVPVGRAVTGMAFEVRGDDGQPAARAVAGEIIVRSRFLATGYWNDAAATARAFESAGNGSERVYKTGDRGRIANDGSLEYLGRLDGRARLRGQWIEMADLEAAICALPGVREVAVAVVDRSEGDARLVAYYVPEHDARPAAPDLRRQLVRRLPAYMVPWRFVELERLPLNANGKVDRAALPRPGPARPNIGPVAEPVSVLQLRLCELWEEILDVAPIGITDDFFDLGGDSLSAVLMIDAVERIVGYSIPPTAPFGEGEVTVERLALVALNESRHTPAIVPIREGGTRPRFFFLHGDYFSDGIYCRELARHLNPEQPFFVLPPCGADGGQLPPSYGDMADQQLQAIRSIQPHGPYILGGECNGGLVAYEIARRLEAEGEQVPLLMLLSASAQNVRLARWAKFLDVVDGALGWPAERRRYLFGRLNGLAINERAESTGGLLRALLRKRSRIVHELGLAVKMRNEKAEGKRTTQPAQGHRGELRAFYQWIDRTYLPGRFNGRVTLIRGREETPDMATECHWWRAVAPNTRGIEVPGDMRTKLTRHVGALAGVIDRLLDETARQWPSANERQAGARSPDANNLRQRTLVGLGWSGATQVLGQLFQLGFSVVIVRLLTPVEFGLVAMVAVFTGFSASLVDCGLGAAIIQKPSPSQAHLNSVFWLNLGVGTLLTLLFSAFAPLIAGFYHEPRLTLVTIGMASTGLLGSLGVVQNALLSKSINLRARFWIESVATVVSGFVAIVLALAGAGVWSLVGQSIALSASRLGMAWQLSPWRPSWSFDRNTTRELLRFARHMAGFNTIVYWENNLEKLAIGRLIGSSPLGIYGLAERLMRMPSTIITATAGGVMFPSISLIQADIDAVKRVYLRSNRLIAAFTFPAMIGLLVMAEPIILSLLGEKWREATLPLQLLCLAGLAQSVYNTSSWIYLSYGRPDLLLRSGIYAFGARLVGVAIGLHWGLLGIVSAYVVGVYTCVLYPTWSAAARLIGLRLVDFLRNVSAPFFCAAGMGVVVWFLNYWLHGPDTQLMRVLIGVPTGIVFYVLLIRFYWIQGWHDFLDLLERSRR